MRWFGMRARYIFAVILVIWMALSTSTAVVPVKKRSATDQVSIIGMGKQPATVQTPTPGSFIQPLLNLERITLVYAFTLSMQSPAPGRWQYYVGANTGQVISRQNNI